MMEKREKKREREREGGGGKRESAAIISANGRLEGSMPGEQGTVHVVGPGPDREKKTEVHSPSGGDSPRRCFVSA